MTKLTKCLVVLMLLNIPVSFADDGMWTFDNPPRKQWKELYNFEPTDARRQLRRIAQVRHLKNELVAGTPRRVVRRGDGRTEPSSQSWTGRDPTFEP